MSWNCSMEEYVVDDVRHGELAGCLMRCYLQSACAWRTYMLLLLLIDISTTWTTDRSHIRLSCKQYQTQLMMIMNHRQVDEWTLVDLKNESDYKLPQCHHAMVRLLTLIGTCMVTPPVCWGAMRSTDLASSQIIPAVPRCQLFQNFCLVQTLIETCIVVGAYLIQRNYKLDGKMHKSPPLHHRLQCNQFIILFGRSGWYTQW